MTHIEKQATYGAKINGMYITITPTQDKKPTWRRIKEPKLTKAEHQAILASGVEYQL